MTAAMLPIGITAAVALGALRPLAPIRDASTLQPLAHMRLVVGPWYVVLAPLYDIWDAMTLLPLRGHVAVLVAATAMYVVWRSRGSASRARRFGWRELARAGAAMSALVAWYALGAVTPRPMASLVVDGPDAVVVDFHSHTDASHDGRRGFSAERNREWHRSAGFDVAYISDHGTFAAVPGALLRNPRHAGEGTVLLPAFETRYSGEHLNVLGFAAESIYGGLPPDALASFSRTQPPAGLLTIPASIGSAPNATPTRGPLIAVELVDGSPRGLEFGLRRRQALAELSARVHAAPVSGSNNHGWGRAAPGWTVLEIPGWRGLTPRMLDSAILATLASPQHGRVVVVERAPPQNVETSVIVADVTRVFRNPFRILARTEQLAWLVWVWLVWWTATLVTRRGALRRRPRVPADVRPT